MKPLSRLKTPQAWVSLALLQGPVDTGKANHDPREHPSVLSSAAQFARVSRKAGLRGFCHSIMKPRGYWDFLIQEAIDAGMRYENGGLVNVPPGFSKPGYNQGYFRISFRRRSIRATFNHARVVCWLVNGPPPTPGHMVDHINRVKSDDRPEKLQAMRDHALSSGGWGEDEANAWDAQEVNALFLQWIAGDCRECPAVLDGVFFEEHTPGKWWYDVNDESGNECDEFGPFESRSEAYWNHADRARPPRADSLEEIDWEEYEVQASAGRISGNLFRGDDGKIYFSLSA